MKLKIILLIVILFGAFACYSNIFEEKVYYAIEINGVLCGYTESSEHIESIGGENYVRQTVKMYIMLSLFGSEFNTDMEITSILNPDSRRCSQLNGELTQGTISRKFDVKVEDNKAIINSSLMGMPKTIELTPQILFGSEEVFSKVKNAFFEQGAEKISFDVLEAIDAEIQNSTFRKIGTENIELAGQAYSTIIVEQHNNKTGVKIKYWVSPDLDYYAMFEILNRKIYLTDHTVVDKIKVASMDGSILVKTNKSISDIQSIKYMKMKVEIQPTGVNLTAEDLNVPGQKFQGTVEDNLIRGILEIQQNKYSGENSPPFPADYSDNESIQKYLLPSSNIESDDPIIIDKAKQITKNAQNSWEAAKMLSKWVSEEIHYAIPGGGSARGAYDMHAGECGAHSMLLAALCRAVGIPARVVYGGMYVPNMGGAFGQHGWNEIYMGNAGWIPVDATAFEIDYIDAGHIRISEHFVTASSFNAKSIEILEYRLGNGTDSIAVADEKYAPYLGKYKHPESEKIFEVLIKEGNLSVDIPGQMVLPFNEQDEQGKWYCKLTNQLYIEFQKDDDNLIHLMNLHEIAALPRRDDSVTIQPEIPEEFQPYIGSYYFPALNAIFRIEYVENTLGLYDPTQEKTIKLQAPDSNGGWLDEYNKNLIFFESDAEGKVTGLKIDASNKFIREL